MKTRREQQLLDDRYRLENPYAHIDELELSVESAEGDPQNASLESIKADRRRLENPFAHVGGDGELAALMSGSTGEVLDDASALPIARRDLPVFQLARKKCAGTYSEYEIKERARNLQAYLWRNRHLIWPEETPEDPLEVLDIQVALRLTGFDLVDADGLGEVQSQDGRMEVGGVLDPSSNRVFVSGQFPLSEQRFTGAHELGHAILHEMQDAVHRDRPFDGVSRSRIPQEKEADRFATHFLMPEKQVKIKFNQIFGNTPFVVSEATAFALKGLSLSDFEAAYPTKRKLSMLLAGSTQYDGRPFVPLNEQFKVSKTAMARALEDLGLINY